MSGTRRLDYITPILHSYTVATSSTVSHFQDRYVLVWKCVHGVASAYLRELCVPVTSGRRLSSFHGCDLHQLDVSSCPECRCQQNSGVFACSGLPADMEHQLVAFLGFMRRDTSVKTHLSTYYDNGLRNGPQRQVE